MVEGGGEGSNVRQAKEEGTRGRRRGLGGKWDEGRVGRGGMEKGKGGSWDGERDEEKRKGGKGKLEAMENGEGEGI